MWNVPQWDVLYFLGEYGFMLHTHTRSTHVQYCSDQINGAQTCAFRQVAHRIVGNQTDVKQPGAPRIEFLARLRNIALEPMFEMQDSVVFDKVRAFHLDIRLSLCTGFFVLSLTLVWFGLVCLVY
jgi:hypothetical protein